MKKKILITLAVLALFVLVLASCGGGGASCEHEWELKSTTATCTDAGEGTYVCSLCQTEEVKSQPALGHDFPAEPNEIKVANCSEGGYSLYICQREGCGHEEQKHVTKEDPSKHNYLPTSKDATCTEPGFTVGICEWCEQEDSDFQPLPALGHTFTRAEPAEGSIVITDAKCGVDGYVTYKCQDCDLPAITKTIADLTGEGATEEDKALAETLMALEHSFTIIANPETDIVAPTCEEPGHTVYTCANNCGTTKSTAGTDQEVAALGHTYNRTGATINLVETKASTCCEEGFKIAKCADCGHFATTEEYEENANLCGVIPTIAHFTGKGGDDYVEVTYHEATCTEDSYWDVKCALDPNCTYGTGSNGEEIATRAGTNFVEALDHEWELYTDVLKNGSPTCLTEGEFRYLCTRCDIYMIDGNSPAKNGVSGTALKAAGYTVDKDEAPLKDNLAADLVKHVYTPGKYVKEPTCVSRGIYACSVCKRQDIVSYEDDIDPEFHNKNQIDNSRVIEVVAPTCHSVGYTIYGCNYDDACTETKKDTYVAMTNHTFAPVTDDGVLVCTVAGCGAAYRDITSTADLVDKDEFCLCGTCEGEITCGGSVEANGSTYAKDPETITENYSKTLDKNIGKGIIELNAEAGTTFTVKVYNGTEEVDTLVNLNVTAGEDGKAYIFLYDVETVTKVEITASAAATVSYYAVKTV